MIYLDYSATTPLDPAVLKQMLPYFSRVFANPASVHTPGQAALKALDDARYGLAELLGVSGHDLTFTSGATEANNLVLRGIADAHAKLKRRHIITTKIEHDSILEPLRQLETQGVAVSYLPVNSKGQVSPEEVIAALRDETLLVSIGYVNSETGSVHPLKQIGRRLRAYNERRLKDWLNTPARKRGAKPLPVLFHSDATQAANFFDCRPAALQTDLMSFSAHKLYGPKGIGLLYAGHELAIAPLLYGGHQERNRRSGTVNVPGAIGMQAAFKLTVSRQAANNKKIMALRDRLAAGILKIAPNAVINTPFASASPSHLNVSFPGFEGDLLQAALDERGVAVSTGSACASGDIDASQVLVAMGRDEAIARSAIRFTLGKMTTSADIAGALRALKAALSSLKAA